MRFLTEDTHGYGRQLDKANEREEIEEREGKQDKNNIESLSIDRD